MAAKKTQRITPDQVEDVKTRHGFDRELAQALVPKGHPKRRIVEHPVLCEQVVKVIRETIDIQLVKFVAAGARQAPATIYAKKPKRRRRIFSPGPQVAKLLRRFMEKCLTELRTSRPPKAVVRRATKHAQVIVVEVVQRDGRLMSFVKS